MITFYNILLVLIATFPLVFQFTGEADYAEKASYQFLVKPLAWGAFWLLLIIQTTPTSTLKTWDIVTFAGLLLVCSVGHYAAAFFFKAFKIFGMSFADKKTDQHRRGQGMQNASTVAAMVKYRKESSRFNWGGVPIPRKLEDRSFLLAGSPGSGKSQAICSTLDSIKGSGDRAIITDPSAQFLRRYKNADSLILNPLDARSEKWSPFSEFTEKTYELDARTIANSLVPTSEGSAEEWNSFVRSFLRDIQIRLWETDQATNERLNFYARIANQEELSGLLNGTPSAANLLGNDKLLGSIRTTGDKFLDPLVLLDPAAGKDSFSVRKWTLEGKGWLFLTYQQNRRSTLAPLMGAQINVYADAMLTRTINRDRSSGDRVWGVFDEFPLLGKVSSIESLLSNGSKHGFAGLIGIQTVSQLRSTYGRETAQTLLACLGTWLVLRCNDAETAGYMSSHAGKEEIMRTNESGGKTDSGSSENWSKQVIAQDVLLPSELQNLPDLQGYLNLAGNYPICPILLQIVEAVADRCNDFEQAQNHNRAKPIPLAAQPAGGAVERQAAEIEM